MIVLSNLFDHGFDALDVASVLNRSGFMGRYCAVGRVASAQMVRSEVMARAPKIQFDILDPTHLNLGDVSYH